MILIIESRVLAIVPSKSKITTVFFIYKLVDFRFEYMSKHSQPDKKVKTATTADD